MKVKGKELILKVVSLVATVLAFVGFAFKFATGKTGKVSSAINFDKWIDSFDVYKLFQKTAVNLWQAARVFLIIALVALAILAVITVIQFFFNHKYLSLAKFIVSIVTIACFVIFFILLIAGGIMLGNKLSSKELKVSFLPHVGAWFMFLFGTVAGVAALLDRKNA